jgi:hypothetical protein
MSKNLKGLKGKSYNEVMNEWAAQQSFLRRASSGLLRPGYDVTGYARLWGWLWRMLILTGVPLLLYMGVLRVYGKGPAFNTQMTAEVKRFLGAENVVLGATRWDLNGELRIASMKVQGKSANIFQDLKAENLSTWITVPNVFKSDWHLKSVDSVKASISLRPGGSPKVASGSPESGSKLLTAGWGIKPDFSLLTVDQYKSDSLTLTWGGNPATTGELTGSNATLTHNGADWDLLLAGGTFRQGWFDQIRVLNAKVKITPDRAVFEKGEFAIAGGGNGTLTGNIALGEFPEVDLTINVENTPFHPFLPEFFQNYVKALSKGTIKLSGSTNRSTGILMDCNFDLLSGKIIGVPVFRALELATEETHVAQPEIKGGHVRFTSQGTQENGGFLLEASDVVLDCGANLKIGLTIRHERKEVQASNAREAAAATGDSVSLTTVGTIRIGLPPETFTKLKPAIRQEFFTREDQGLHWMEAPYRMEDGEFTKDTADRIIALHNGGK